MEMGPEPWIVEFLTLPSKQHILQRRTAWGEGGKGEGTGKFYQVRILKLPLITIQ